MWAWSLQLIVIVILLWLDYTASSILLIFMLEKIIFQLISVNPRLKCHNTICVFVVLK